MVPYILCKLPREGAAAAGSASGRREAFAFPCFLMKVRYASASAILGAELNSAGIRPDSDRPQKRATQNREA